MGIALMFVSMFAPSWISKYVFLREDSRYLMTVSQTCSQKSIIEFNSIILYLFFLIGYQIILEKANCLTFKFFLRFFFFFSPVLRFSPSVELAINHLEFAGRRLSLWFLCRIYLMFVLYSSPPFWDFFLSLFFIFHVDVYILL